MAYGHAERTLAAIRLLETQTVGLLFSLPWLDAEQSNWLKEARQACPRAGLSARGRADTSLSARGRTAHWRGAPDADH